MKITIQEVPREANTSAVNLLTLNKVGTLLIYYFGQIVKD
jgi:hypothetical protein